MNEPLKFESREMRIDTEIDNEIESIRQRSPLQLPGKDAPIVQHYVQKIQGTYNVDNAKKDTDHAVDLLYIAYNTTPQESDNIRLKINAIMIKLIKAQEESKFAMDRAIYAADDLVKSLNRCNRSWLDPRVSNSPDEIKAFVIDDLREVANEIKEKATGIQTELNRIAKSYDNIIDETVKVTNKSEKELAARLRDKKKLEDEINEANAESARLDSLVQSLEAQVQKFERKAAEFEKRAVTAEERSFVMSIVQMGVQTISALIPPIAVAASGGKSLLAASTLLTANQAKGAKDSAVGADTKDDIQTLVNISQKKADKEIIAGKIKDLEEEIERLEERKARLTGAADEDGNDTGAEAGAETDGTDDDADEDGDAASSNSTEEDDIDAQIEEKTEELETEKEKLSALEKALEDLTTSLGKVSDNLGKMADKHQSDAADLRKLQMDMLEKAWDYEDSRRKQAADLVKINALLKGKRTEEETIKLTIRSLNLSLSALKRAQEIIREIASFFKSFADYMDHVSNQADSQIKDIDSTAKKKTLGKFYLEGVVNSTDEFFIQQTGQWNAVRIVSGKFVQTFEHGFSKLNRLKGTYIQGDKLTAYMDEAAERLREIKLARQMAAEENMRAIDDYIGRPTKAAVGA